MAALARVDVLRGEFTCPLSFELLKDPVRDGTCGHVFERAWIQQWVIDHNTCPLSRQPLTLEGLQEHSSIRSACAFLDPERVEPLTEEDLEFVEVAAQMLRERRADDAVQVPPVPPRVDRAVHDSIYARLVQLAQAGTRATTQYYRNIC